MSNLSIHKRYLLAYPREAVFDIWVSPKAVVAPVTAIDVMSTTGGKFKLTVDGEQPSHMIGKFLLFDRPVNLVYTWEWNKDGEISQVAITFNAIDEGTEVIIDHTGFDQDSSRETHDSGWDSYINGIIHLLENG